MGTHRRHCNHGGWKVLARARSDTANRDRYTSRNPSVALLWCSVSVPVFCHRRGDTGARIVEPTIDAGRRPILCCEPRWSATTGRGRGRGRRWGQTSTYRFAAVKLNAGVKVDVKVDVERHGNGHERATCDESSDGHVNPTMAVHVKGQVDVYWTARAARGARRSGRSLAGRTRANGACRRDSL